MCNCPTRKWTTSEVGYSTPVQVPLSRTCNSYLVQNVGNTLVIINSWVVVQPGQAYAVGGNENEIQDGARLDIDFRLPTPAPLVPVNGAVAIQKIYVS